MKKLYFLFITSLCFVGVNAQVFVENFETATVGGNLEDYNDWYVSLKASDALGVSPKIGAGALTYTGYIGANVGDVAVLDSTIGNTSATQRISTRRIISPSNDTLKVGDSGSVYVAFLINVNSQSYRSYRDFFTFEGSESSSFTRGRIFAKNNTAGDQVYFAVSKNSSTSTILDANSTQDLNLTLSTGVDYLIVAKYTIVDGDQNDVITMYVNPDLSKTEGEQTNKITTSDIQSDYSSSTALKINLRQRGIGAKIGGIRVAKTWDEVLLSNTTSVKGTKADNEISICSAGKNIITSESGMISVYTLDGALKLFSITDGNLSTSLNKGLYIVRFVLNNGKITSSKIEIR